jgi:hypothetical protein
LPDRRPAESKVLIVSLPSTAITLVEREWASNISLDRFAQKGIFFLIVSNVKCYNNYFDIPFTWSMEHF